MNYVWYIRVKVLYSFTTGLGNECWLRGWHFLGPEQKRVLIDEWHTCGPILNFELLSYFQLQIDFYRSFEKWGLILFFLTLKTSGPKMCHLLSQGVNLSNEQTNWSFPTYQFPENHLFLKFLITTVRISYKSKSY